jgi:hypothetical protein
MVHKWVAGSGAEPAHRVNPHVYQQEEVGDDVRQDDEHHEDLRPVARRQRHL